MPDDYKQDDYQYPEGEFSTGNEIPPLNPEEPAGGNPQDLNGLKNFWQSNKRIIVIVIAAALIALVFKMFSGGPKKVKPVPLPPQSAPMQVAVAPKPQVSTGLLDAQNAVKQAQSQVEQNKTAIQELQGQLQDIQNSLSNIQSTQTQLSQTVTSLTDQTAKIAEQLKPVAKAKPVIPVTPVTYYLRAIIPGRAWIQGSNGDARSVSVGDTIPQYGRVEYIDPDQGTVTGSTGKVIGFNEDDS